MDGSARMCRKSRPPVWKPDRAHYCRVARACILKMDHHFPWADATVGFYNYKFFVLFLLHAALTLDLTVASLATASTPPSASLAELFQFFGLGALGLPVTLLFVFHVYLVRTNHTTIEFLEKRGCTPPPGYVNKYDLGPWRNACSVLGTNPLFWVLPVRLTCEGDGLGFRINTESALTESGAVGML